MPRLPRRIRKAAGLLALALAACTQAPAIEGTNAKPRLGLFTTLPIYWGEGDIASMIGGEGERDWVREELEARFELVPLDTLEPEALAGLDKVILAQPRPLAPSENLSLDDWVAEGGTALILADPMLTRHSPYPLGDRRRPHDMVVLSPILTRWGLELTFDEGQPVGERAIAIGDESYPVNLAGRFGHAGGDAAATCSISGEAVLARCRRGAGRVTLFADAAILDSDESQPVSEERRRAFRRLTRSLTR